MTPQAAYDKLPEPEEGRKYDWDVSRYGRLPLADLLAVVEHHSTRQCTVSSESFGLLDIDRRDLAKRLRKMVEDIAPRMAERHPEHQLEALAVCSLRYEQPKSGRTWKVNIHTVGLFVVGDEKDQYYRLWS